MTPEEIVNELSDMADVEWNHLQTRDDGVSVEPSIGDERPRVAKLKLFAAVQHLGFDPADVLEKDESGPDLRYLLVPRSEPITQV